MGGGVGGTWTKSTREILGTATGLSLGGTSRAIAEAQGSLAGRLQFFRQSLPALDPSGQAGQS